MSALSGSEIIRVVDELIGATEAYGDSYIDHDRLINQEKMKEVAGHLMYRLWKNTKYAKRFEHSMKEIGNDACEFLGYIVEELNLNEFVKREEEND